MAAIQACELKETTRSSYMPRILHIVGDSQYGGGGVLIQRFAAEAICRGYHASVLTTDPIFQENLRTAGIGVVDLGCIWRPIRPGRDIMGLARLARYLRRERYDIVHTHTSKAGFVGRLAARWARVPVIVHTVHGFAFHEASSPFALRAFASLERAAAHCCDMLVTVSQYHCDWAERLRIGTSEKRVAICNGIDPARVRPNRAKTDVRHELGVSESQCMLLTLGRLARQKGLDILLDAISRLPADFPVCAVIAGDGPERKSLIDTATKLAVEARVRFLGFRTDLGDLLNAADIVVLPSLWEGLSISLLEAMAAGKPIITTDIGSNMEVTRNGEVARIVRAGDVSELAAAMIEVTSNTAYQARLSHLARAEFERRYTECHMLDQYMALYDRLLLQHTSRNMPRTELGT